MTIRLFDHRLTEDVDGTPLGVDRVELGEPITQPTPTQTGGIAGWVTTPEKEKHR